jgi:hypothetical protein
LPHHHHRSSSSIIITTIIIITIMADYYDESLSSGASPNPSSSSSYLPESEPPYFHATAPNIPPVDFDDPTISALPRILLMGPRRSGKTSIQRVVFHKMSPHETLFRLEATQCLERAVVDHTPLCRFTIWDFPGDQYETASGEEGKVDSDEIFQKATALIFVLDAQDEPYDHVLQSFTDAVTRAVRANPSIAIGKNSRRPKSSQYLCSCPFNHLNICVHAVFACVHSIISIFVFVSIQSSQYLCSCPFIFVACVDLIHLTSSQYLCCLCRFDSPHVISIFVLLVSI